VGSLAGTHPLSYSNKSRCTFTSDSSTSSQRELSGAFHKRELAVSSSSSPSRFIYLFPFPPPFSVTFTLPRALGRKVPFLPAGDFFSSPGELRRLCSAPRPWDSQAAHSTEAPPAPRKPRFPF
jgi:hypothetical protein